MDQEYYNKLVKAHVRERMGSPSFSGREVSGAELS